MSLCPLLLLLLISYAAGFVIVAAAAGVFVMVSDNQRHILPCMCNFPQDSMPRYCWAVCRAPRNARVVVCMHVLCGASAVGFLIPLSGIWGKLTPIHPSELSHPKQNSLPFDSSVWTGFWHSVNRNCPRWKVKNVLSHFSSTKNFWAMLKTWICPPLCKGPPSDYYVGLWVKRCFGEFSLSLSKFDLEKTFYVHQI